MIGRDERGRFAVLCDDCGEPMTTADRLIAAIFLKGRALCERCLARVRA
jgi:formylmethanofuran dehydrogenase subunit E